MVSNLEWVHKIMELTFEDFESIDENFIEKKDGDDDESKEKRSQAWFQDIPYFFPRKSQFKSTPASFRLRTEWNSSS